MSANNGRELKRVIFIIALAVALQSCLPVTSKSPVGSTSGFRVDDRLIGMWQGTTSNGQVFFAFLPDDHRDIMAVMIGFPLSVNSSGFYGSYRIRTATLGKALFIDAHEVSENNGQPPTGSLAENSIPLLYRLDGERKLTLYLLDEKATKEAVKAGKIAGIVESSDYGDVTLTAPQAELDKFFASSAGLALFKQPMVALKRVQ